MKNGKRKFGDDAKNWDEEDVTRPARPARRGKFGNLMKPQDSTSHMAGDTTTSSVRSKTSGVADPAGSKDLHVSTRDDASGDGGDASKGGFKESVVLFVHSWRIWVAVLIILLAVAAPFVWVKGIQPAIDRSRIDSDPKIKESKAAIIPYDHVWVKTPLNTKTVDGTDVNENQMVIKQKSKEAGDTTCLVFHAEGKDAPTHTVKVTGAFGDPKTRDFFNAQQYVLEQGMKSGKIKVEVCLLLTEDEYSALATEALGEIDYNNQKNSWRAIMSLLRVDADGLKTGDARVGAVMNVVNSIPDVDGKVKIRKESIKNGSFLQWARLMTNENSVEKIPALWIDDKNYSSNEKYKITNPDWLMNMILNLS